MGDTVVDELDAVGEVVVLHEIELVLCARRSDNPRTHRDADLNRCQPDTPCRRMHQESLAGSQRRSVGEADVRSLVDDPHRRRFLECHLGRQSEDPLLWSRHDGGEATVGKQGAHAITDRKTIHSFADLTNDAGDLRTRRERQLRAHLVLALRDHDVEEVAPGGADIDHDAARLSPHAIEILALQGGRASELAYDHPVHGRRVCLQKRVATSRSRQKPRHAGISKRWLGKSASIRCRRVFFPRVGPRTAGRTCAPKHRRDPRMTRRRMRRMTSMTSMTSMTRRPNRPPRKRRARWSLD